MVEYDCWQSISSLLRPVQGGKNNPFAPPLEKSTIINTAAMTVINKLSPMVTFNSKVNNELWSIHYWISLSSTWFLLNNYHSRIALVNGLKLPVKRQILILIEMIISSTPTKLWLCVCITRALSMHTSTTNLLHLCVCVCVCVRVEINLMPAKQNESTSCSHVTIQLFTVC